MTAPTTMPAAEVTSASAVAPTTAATTAPAPRAPWIARGASLGLAVALWLVPVPDGLTAAPWHLFALFAAAIVAVVSGALPILTASLFAVAAAVLLDVITPAAAWSGFANGTIVLIVVAFLVARAVVTCGLGERIGHAVVQVFGRSTLGLSYSLFLVDAVVAPAFPSNTARSGVLYSLAVSVADTAGARPNDPSRARLGSFLMFSGIASLTLSSGLWLTAMAANPLGTEIARGYGVEIGFGSWLLASAVPTLVAMAVLPWLLFRVIKPEITTTPDAPAAARTALAALGPLRRNEWIVTITFLVMVSLWASASAFGLDATAVAVLGLGVFLATGVLTSADIAKEGDVLATFIWFALLFAMSSQLNEMGFMSYVGERLALVMQGWSWVVAGLALVLAYVLLHFLFVSQTAHLLALFGVFMDVGVKVGVPAMPLALLLLFATNFFSAITPQASSANLLFAGSGYLSQRDLYRLGAITTACNLLIYLLVGTPWFFLVMR